jgi:cysteine-rich repeat protein
MARRIFRLGKPIALTLFGAMSIGASCGGGGGGGNPDASTGGSAGAGGVAGTGGAVAGAAGAAGSAGSSPDAGDAANEGGSAGVSGAGGAATGGAAGGPPDAAPDGPPSLNCGDGIRDPITEECDDSTGVTPPDSCNAQCQVEDVLIVPGAPADGGVPPKVSRRLGGGRHPVGAGDSGSAVAFVTSLPAPVGIGLKTFDSDGTPAASPIAVAADPSITANAAPVVAALPGGKYAVAYTDLNADGDGLGVALRIVNGASGTVGGLTRVNTTTTFGQHDPDLIWTGTEIVIAWVDDSKLPTAGTELKVRHFTATGTPAGGETALGPSNDFENGVALAPFAGNWAAAWRIASATGEIIGIQAGTSAWTVALTAPGPAEDKPALAELDGSHLLLGFTEGGGSTSTPRLRGAVLDTSAPGSATAFPIDPAVEPYKSDSALGQSHPNVVRTGSRVYAAWRSSLVPGAPEAEELWLKQIGWASGTGSFTLDLSAAEIPLPRWPVHFVDDQRAPALAASPLGPEGALATAWDDYGRVFGSIEGTPDIVAELIPVPVVRFTTGGAGQ